MMWSVFTRRSVMWLVWDWWSVREFISQFYGWLLIMVISVVCFGPVVNPVVDTLIGFDWLTVLLRVWDGWSALSLFHFVNCAWIDYFSMSSVYSKTGNWIFLKIPQKICLD